MYSFFVLGQIPGTGIVISFTMWLQAMLAVTLIVAYVKYRRHLSTTHNMVPTISNDDIATAR